MKLEDFTSEILDEIKSAKDLVKGELPLIAQEYIRAQKVRLSIQFWGSVLILLSGLISMCIGFHTMPQGHNDGPWVVFVFVGGCAIFVGGVMSFCNGMELLNYKLQPRRMAIKAITSLKD